MSIRTGTFVLVLVLMPGWGCSQRHILRMSNPELSTTVTLFDQGVAEDNDDDTVIVLDEPNRIAKVAAFFEKRADKWVLLDDDSQRPRRVVISFRKGDRDTDRFWLERDRLCLRSHSGEYYTCELSDAERAELLSIFRFPTNFKSASSSS